VAMLKLRAIDLDDSTGIPGTGDCRLASNFHGTAGEQMVVIVSTFANFRIGNNIETKWVECWR
jgi:hypothetical protein